jgi:Skp family chaperone for outer membrane proteins
MRHILLSVCCLLVLQFTVSAQKANYRVAVVGFYNLENLYDTINDPTKR